MPSQDNQSPSSLDSNRRPEQAPRMLNWHIPHFLKRLLPKFVVNGLRRFKGRSLTSEFPRDREFEQSQEDVEATNSMSIIVPIHDAPKVTRRCLASLERYAPKAEIILVDDASNLAETLEVIREFSTRNGWKVIRHENSHGHSEACRAGVNLATRPFLCLLNSDTVVTPWCWRQVKEVFEHDQKIGVAGPSTSHSGNRQTLTLADDLRIYWNDNQIWAFAERLLTECEKPLIVDLPWVSGFALFIRHSLWEQLGGFDKNVPDYGNEVELCNRVAARGYRLVWIRDCYIHHFGRQSYEDTLGEQGILARSRAADAYNRQKNGLSAP
jgi:GT2 family glycosyltransferase